MIGSETSTCTLECLDTCIRKSLMYVSVMKILIKNTASLSMNTLSFSVCEALCVLQHLPGPDRQSPQRLCLADLLIINNQRMANSYSSFVSTLKLRIVEYKV